MGDDPGQQRQQRAIVARHVRAPASTAWPRAIHHRGDGEAPCGRQPLARALCCIWLALAATAPAGAPAADRSTEALRQHVETLRTAGDADIGAGSAAARAIVASIYEQRGFAPLWADAQRAASLLAAIEASTTHGLDPRDYHAGRIAGLLPPRTADSEAGRRAERELLLTDAFMRLAYHLVFGKADPRSLQHGWNFARTLAGVDPAAALAKLLAAPDPAAALESVAPRLARYRDLRLALARLREVEGRGGWPAVGTGPKLEAGSTDSRVAQLRARLHAGGDLAAPSDDPHFDAELEAAVRRFQARHGLEVDGIVGRATLAALNVPVAQRIEQVRANLERLRWVAHDLAGEYLLVDIAGFAAELWLDDAPAWIARVVIGKPFRTTPEFRARMKYLVLNPEWNVPPTILHEDVLPPVLRDPGYLDRHAMRLVDRAGRPVDAAAVDWARFRARPDTFPYRIVQSPGGDNPLGGVKFMFPNDHAVYLHDTPSPALFDRTVRAASSGCIRIERPLELARLLLDDPQRWSTAQLQEAIAGGGTRTLPVRRNVPVLLLYFTATAGADGEPHFRPDLYDRDRPIIRALGAPFRFAPVERTGRAAAVP
jgi:murein L,D-transpeptidase YcbB/YkuD